MFYDTKVFNQPLDRWNLTAAVRISGMFCETWRFNQPLISWNVAAIPDKQEVFKGAFAFRQPETMAVWRAQGYTE
jgi:hypothetical protein